MGHFTKSDQYAVLALLLVLTGCTLPASGHRDGAVVGGPTSVVAVVNPNQTCVLGVFEARPSSPPVQTASQVAYQAPANARAAPPTPSVEPAPLPETVPTGSTQAKPVPFQSPQAVPEPAAADVQSVYLPADPADPFYGKTELPVEQLVAEVQARNPSLQAASAAWRAAAERYPQAVSLDDPMFNYMLGTQSIGMDNGGGWMVQASQKIPWAGKRALRGSVASAEADAMRGDIGNTRLRLAEAARTAFYDYYLAWRQMEVNASTRKIVTQFREIAWNKYQVNQTTQQDVLQADVELATLESRRTELARDQQVAIARINTLLHRVADHPLPLPPAKVPLLDSVPAADELQQAAARSRPDLFAQQARVQAEQASLDLAYREYYPDLNVVGKYDGFMPENMRPQVGMDLNVPIRFSRRSAAVREAENRIAQRRAEYQNLLDQVRFEVQSGRDRASQSQRVVHLYEEKILPAAQRSLQSAQANYTTGTLDFLRLLDAERQLNTQREMYYQSIADYHRRLAELERAVGGPLPEAIDVR
ncbi:MAG: TolC family protein [Pirellulales bacterium]